MVTWPVIGNGTWFVQSECYLVQNNQPQGLGLILHHTWYMALSLFITLWCLPVVQSFALVNASGALSLAFLLVKTEY